MPKRAYFLFAISLAVGGSSARAQRFAFRAPSIRAPSVRAWSPMRVFRPMRPAPMRRNPLTPARPPRFSHPSVQQFPQPGTWSTFGRHSFANPAPGSMTSDPPGGSRRSWNSSSTPASSGWSRFSAHSFAKPGPGSRTFSGANRTSNFARSSTGAGPMGSRFTSGAGGISRRSNPWFGASVFVGSFPSPFFANAFIFPTFPRFFFFNSFFFSPFFFARPFFNPFFVNPFFSPFFVSPFFTPSFAFFDPFFFSGAFQTSPVFFEPLFFNPFLLPLHRRVFFPFRARQALTEPPALDFGRGVAPSAQPATRGILRASIDLEQAMQINEHLSAS